MKKIFTLMWAIVCAALTIVSCTPDTPEDDPQGPANTSKITVTGAPEANLTPAAGELSLGYAIENATLTDALVVTTEAAWVKVGEIGEATVALTYEANTDAPGSPAREAVIKFAYNGAEDVLVTLKQDTASSTFTVTFDEATLTCGYAAYTWATENTEIAYVVLSTQDLAGFGIAGETPTEQLTNYLSTVAGYGMLTEEFLGQYWYKGAPEEGMYKDAYRYDANESVQVYAVGFSAEDTGEIDPNWETPIYKINLLTPIHAWEVPFKPYTTVVVAEEDLTKNVTSAAGEITIDCVVENPLEGETVLCQTEAAWVVPTWADNKLTLTYEANTAAVARRAKIAIQYGYYTNPFEITLVQEKDANAVATTLEVKVTGTTFNGIWVDVTPSDANALYALDTTTPEKNWETGAELPMDWATVGENLLSYVPGTTTFHKGELKGHFIKMNPSNYEWYGLDYYVYAVAVDATSEEGTDYFGNPETTWTVSGILSDVYYDRTTIDNSKTPSVVWDLTKNPELVWNATNERYDLEVVENSTVVLHFIVNNPADGAFLALNGNSLYDSFNVVDGEPVVDNAAGTVTIKIDKFDTSKNYHYVTPSFKYTNADGDTWGITTPSLRLTQVEAPAAAEKFSKIEKVEDLTAGEYYMAGYLTEYSYNGTTNDWSANPYHIAQGYGTSSGKTDLYTTPYAYTGGDLVMKAGESYAAKITTLEAVEGKANTYYVKLDGKYLYSASAANRQLGGGDEPKEWVASNGAKGGIYLTSVENPVILGTAGATSKILRSYTDDSNLKYGLVFFKENK